MASTSMNKPFHFKANIRSSLFCFYFGLQSQLHHVVLLKISLFSGGCFVLVFGPSFFLSGVFRFVHFVLLNVMEPKFEPSVL